MAGTPTCPSARRCEKSFRSRLDSFSVGFFAQKQKGKPQPGLKALGYYYM